MDVFVTGGTGYLGRALIPALQARRHRVRAMVRPGSEGKVPAGVEIVPGDPLRAGSYAALRSGETLVHLVGVPHPSPAKAAEFIRIDLASAEAAALGAGERRIAHFVYLSVSQPLPVMRAYVAARVAGEAAISAIGIPATILRPFYVIGPGHYWPLLVVPLMRLAEAVPAWRGDLRRMRPVSLRQMVAALVAAVEDPPAGIRIVDVAAIRGGMEP